MTDYKELIEALREEAEAVQAIEWDIPICTSNHILDAAAAIEQLVNDRNASVDALKAIHDNGVVVLPRKASVIEWNEVITRHLTDEEAAYYSEMQMDGIEYIFDCKMPEDGQEILIATKWGTDKDICSNDGEYGIGLEGRGDWDGVFAWAEMPSYDKGCGVKHIRGGNDQ